MMQPIYIWERAIDTRSDIAFSEFRLENGLVIFAFGELATSPNGRKIPIKWTCDGKCYLRYTSRRYPDADIKLNSYD